MKRSDMVVTRHVPLTKMARSACSGSHSLCPIMAAPSIYDFTVETLEGQLVSLSKFRGKYHRLNALMDMYGDLNFTVLGFPCNQFGLQAPEGNHETLNVLRCVRPGGGFVPKFPIFGKVEVNGQHEDPLFTYLKESLPYVNPVIGDIKKFYWSPINVNDIRWNFEKFLVHADGIPFRRYELHSPITEVEKDIAELLCRAHC